MATFGSTINPSLGRIDYSQYAQGAAQGAAMQAQGMQAMGQGIGKLLEGAGQAVNAYYEKKEEKKLFDSGVAAVSKFIGENGPILGIKDQNDTSAIGAALKGLGEGDVKKGVRIGLGMLDQFRAQKTENNAIKSALSSVVPEANRESVYASLGGQNPLEFGKYLSNQQIAKAQTEHLNAETNVLNKKTEPQQDFSVPLGVYQDMINKGGAKFTGAPDPRKPGYIIIKEMSSPTAGQHISIENKGEETFSKALETKRAEKFMDVINAVPNHYNTIEQIKSIRNAVASGTVSEGELSDFKLKAKSTINSFSGTPLYDISQEEFAKKSFSDLALSAATRMHGQGSITESERALLANTVAKYGNSLKANELIMNFMEQAANREIKKAAYLSDLYTNKKLEVGSEMDFMKNNPLDFSDFTPPKNTGSVNRANAIVKPSKH